MSSDLKAGELYRFVGNDAIVGGLCLWKTMRFSSEVGFVGSILAGDVILLLAAKPPQEHQNLGADDAYALQVLTSDGKVGWVISRLGGRDHFVPVSAERP